MFADGHQHLSSHVSTFLGTRSLILNVNPGSTTFNKELGEFQNSGETSMSGIGVGDDGAEVIDIGI